jgi:hypothetical protein
LLNYFIEYKLKNLMEVIEEFWWEICMKFLMILKKQQAKKKEWQ